ncbi:MAG: hypothetical protein ABI686_04435 [Acidobacteriota bacterium]
MLKQSYSLKLYFIILILFALVLSGCSGGIIKTKDKRATLLKTEDVTQSELLDKISHFASVNSLRAKMDLKFEDNSYAELGIAEKYRTADGEVVVQRPASILLKVQVPVLKYDVAQMTSDGEKFRVAILEDGAGGKYKKFVVGTNNADYSALQEEVSKMDFDKDGKVLKQNANVFANLRPQHFTDAMLMRPIDTTANIYVESTIVQEETTPDVAKKSPLANVLRGYYLLDELHKNDDGSLKITRRFWFDRVGMVRLARQQIFDANGEIDSDIVYGDTGNLTDTGEYNNLPLRIEVTRPKEKYKMRLTYQAPEAVTIGKMFPSEAFVLENRWNLEVVDLDKKLQSAKAQKAGTDVHNVDARNQ